MDALADSQVTVEVVYATASLQRQQVLSVAVGTTVRDVAVQSDLARYFTSLDLATCPLGVWGQAVDDQQLVADGDRVELYRPLQQDPREARMRLASEGKTMGGAS
ncbi:MAG: RnfH family protein [Pseudomonadota bacterium]